MFLACLYCKREKGCFSGGRFIYYHAWLCVPPSGLPRVSIAACFVSVLFVCICVSRSIVIGEQSMSSGQSQTGMLVPHIFRCNVHMIDHPLCVRSLIYIYTNRVFNSILSTLLKLDFELLHMLIH